MILTNEERLECRNLVGYCEPCDEWYNLVDQPDSPASRLHHCGGKPSTKPGFQLTTQRTFNATAKKLTKSQLKKMSGVGA